MAMTEISEDQQHVDRRTMLRRTAMGTALVWTTPVILTLDASVAAASTVVFVGCPPEGGGTPPTRIDLKWNGTADNCVVNGTPDNALEGIGGDTTSPLGTVDIYVTFGTGNGESQAGDQLFQGVTVGSVFSVGGVGTKLNPNAKFYIYAPGTEADIAGYRTTSATPIRFIQVHTSCSQPLVVGDKYCGLELVGGTF